MLPSVLNEIKELSKQQLKSYFYHEQSEQIFIKKQPSIRYLAQVAADSWIRFKCKLLIDVIGNSLQFVKIPTAFLLLWSTMWTVECKISGNSSVHKIALTWLKQQHFTHINLQQFLMASGSMNPSVKQGNR